MTKLIFASLCVSLLLASCAAPRVSVDTQIPPALTTTPGLLSAGATSPPLATPFPTASGIPPTGTPMTAEIAQALLPRLEAGSPVTLASLHMVDLDVGWGIEQGGQILRTRDGGSTWQDVTPPQGLYNADGFFALDADMAWATEKPSDLCDASLMTWSDYQTCMPGPDIVIWRTMDGGQTWQAGEPYEAEDGHYKPIAIQFIDAGTGWFLYVSSFGPMGSTTMGMAKTEDGGISWVRATAPQSMCIHRTLMFINMHAGWSGADCRFTPTVGAPLQDFINGKGAPGLGSLAPELSRTTDGSQSWAYNTLPSPRVFPDELTSPNADPNISILCGTTNMEWISSETFTLQWTCSSEMGTPPFIDFSYQYLTSDSGQTWHSWLATGNEFFLNAQMGWRLYSPGEGQVSQLQRTTNSGQVWKTIKTVTWQSAQFDFVSEQIGWAIVTSDDATALAHTTDGGQTWVDVHPMVSASAETQPDTAMFLGNLQRTGVYGTNSTETITGKLKWKKQLGYSSFSSPAIIDGTIYYASDRTGFLALDSNSGQVKWSYPVSLLFYGATPAVADGIVYFSEQGVDSENHDISCLYAADVLTGQEKWKICVPGWATEDSPAISNGTVYFGSSVGLLALDARTGQEKWRVGPGILGSLALADGVLYFNGMDDRLYAMDAGTREALWIFRMDPNYDYTRSTPAVANGMVYLGGPDYLYAVDAKTGQEQWKFEAGREVKSVVADGKTVYFVSTSSEQIVYALDAFTGKVKWKFNLGHSGQTHSSPALSNGVLYVGSANQLCALDAKTGLEKWRYSEFEMVTGYGEFSTPVIADGVLYFDFGHYLYAIK